MRAPRGTWAAPSCRELAYALQNLPAADSAQHTFASTLRTSLDKSKKRQVLRLRQFRYSDKLSCVTS